MTDVKAAAERLRLCTHPIREGKFDDLTDVVTAYLAEHPSDDEQSVDEAWLRAVGFVLFYGSWRFRDSVILVPRGKKFGINPADVWSEIKTRGNVRLLCRALKIKLRDAGVEAPTPLNTSNT